LQQNIREDEEEVLEKIDLLQSLQKECLEEKEKILHDLQKLVQKKDQLCSEYERHLLKLLPPPLK
ncbi:hec ndc80p family protein, partial [Cystoisospora suis]